MKIEYYPSLELCKELTEAGFPRTQYQYEKNSLKRSQRSGEVVLWDNGYSYTDKTWLLVLWDKGYSYTDKTWLLEAVCPSVMEMLDVIYPKRSIAEIISRWEKQMGPNRMGEHTNISLPDFLAKEIIWLHAENRISFSK